MFRPTAILDCDYDCLPEAVQDLERYNEAQVLVRVLTLLSASLS